MLEDRELYDLQSDPLQKTNVIDGHPDVVKKMRGELYRVFRPSRGDPRRSRVFVIVSRPPFIHSRSSTVICAPVYTSYHGLESQVFVGLDEGLKQQSAIHCDALISLSKSTLTNYVGRLSSAKMSQLNHALAVALGLG